MKIPSNLPNSLLFTGDAEKEALKFAEELLRPGHPDIRHYYPEGKVGMHSIASMRQFSKEVYMAPFEGTRKVFIIHDAERMLPTSSNALLKTFEEPSLDSIIILVTNKPTKLLPTILSRCTKVVFPPKAEHSDSPVRQDILNIMGHGKFASYKELKTTVDTLSAKVSELQDSEKSAIREQMLAKYTDDLSATQKEAVEKELEGLMATKFNTHTESLFYSILSWYRDLELLKTNGKPELLMNPDYEEALVQCLQWGNTRPIEEVTKIVEKAKLSLQRFTPLNLVLERLFLELNVLA